MEDVLALYAEPEEPRYPQGGVDESPVPLTRETRPPRPPRPRYPERYDTEYKWEGPAHRFGLVQPWRGWRHVKVTQQRPQQDFAQQMRLLVDPDCPTAERIRLGVDHLNPHTPAARYGAFPLDEARRITRKLEFHYTPKQGRWLNRAGGELAVLAGQCLARRLSTIDPLREDIAAWEGPRHQRQTKIHWQFGTEVARVKLKRLYPSVESTEDSVGPEAS
jgi:hypothetical protein